MEHIYAPGFGEKSQIKKIQEDIKQLDKVNNFLQYVLIIITSLIVLKAFDKMSEVINS